jgi:hypothetical protein
MDFIGGIKDHAGNKLVFVPIPMRVATGRTIDRSQRAMITILSLGTTAKPGTFFAQNLARPDHNCEGFLPLGDARHCPSPQGR